MSNKCQVCSFEICACNAKFYPNLSPSCTFEGQQKIANDSAPNSDESRSGKPKAITGIELKPSSGGDMADLSKNGPSKTVQMSPSVLQFFLSERKKADEADNVPNQVADEVPDMNASVGLQRSSNNAEE